MEGRRQGRLIKRQLPEWGRTIRITFEVWVILDDLSPCLTANRQRITLGWLADVGEWFATQHILRHICHGRIANRRPIDPQMTQSISRHKYRINDLGQRLRLISRPCQIDRMGNRFDWCRGSGVVNGNPHLLIDTVCNTNHVVGGWGQLDIRCFGKFGILGDKPTSTIKA